MLTATTAITSFPAIANVPTKPTQVRFWVSGQGSWGRCPIAALPPSLDAAPGRRSGGGRAHLPGQVLAGGTPAYTITPPQGFAAP